MCQYDIEGEQSPPQLLPDKMIECQQFYVVQLNINKLKDFHNEVELLFEKECIAQSKLRNYFEIRGFFISKTFKLIM